MFFLLLVLTEPCIFHQLQVFITPLNKKVFAMEERTYAVIRAAGKQHLVTPGERIVVDRIEAEVGAKITLAEVLLLNPGSEGDVKIGTPLISGAKVTASVEKHLRGPKLIAFKKKRRKRYERKVGHRSELTALRIDKIED